MVEEVVEDQYYEVPEEEITTNLDGKFAAAARGGKLYYYGESLGNNDRVAKYTITFLDADGNVIEEVVVREGESVEAPEVPNKLNGLYFRGWDKELDEINSDMTVSAIYSGPSDVDLGMENDFEWVNSTSTGSYYNKDGEQGYFRYIGTGKEVIEIPHVIQGVEMTSYYRMFYQTGEDVKKVISTNENVTSMGSMFQDSQSTSLDLSSFDTSNVTSMYSMFQNSQATSLDLSSFDTSNVTNMQNMFQDSQATELDLSSFDTSSVTTMSWMFYGSQATSLDLSNFDTSNVNYMDSMFQNSQATELDLSSFDTSSVITMSYMLYNSQTTELDLSSFDTSNVTHMNYMFQNSQATTGYARTQEDADRFNATSGKPVNLTFQVKSN